MSHSRGFDQNRTKRRCRCCKSGNILLIIVTNTKYKVAHEKHSPVNHFESSGDNTILQSTHFTHNINHNKIRFKIDPLRDGESSEPAFFSLSSLIQPFLALSPDHSQFYYHINKFTQRMRLLIDRINVTRMKNRNQRGWPKKELWRDWTWYYESQPEL